MPSASVKLEHQGSQDALDPFHKVMNLVEKKTRNLEKRKVSGDGARGQGVEASWRTKRRPCYLEPCHVRPAAPRTCHAAPQPPPRHPGTRMGGTGAEAGRGVHEAGAAGQGRVLLPLRIWVLPHVLPCGASHSPQRSGRGDQASSVPLCPGTL